ncbi:MAG: putative LPS assembly protein LptD [candidate division WOR-3 bacterium]
MPSPFLLSIILIAIPDSLNQDIVYYGGKRAIFLAQEEQVVLLDSAWVRYRDMSVCSDSINYSVKTHILSAHNSVTFRTATEQVFGTELYYNVDTRKGMMRNASTQVENGFLSAREVWLVKEKVLNARYADYTTCDLPKPHYTFFGPRVKLFMDDIAITEPVLLKIHRLPLLAAPFWLIPVASRRKSGLMPFKVGSAKDQGYYAKNISYYWVINDYADATFITDIMTKKGIQFRTEAVYIVEPYSRGSIQGSYIREAWDPQNPNRLRYSFNLASETKPTPLTNLAIQTELVSDTAYAPDYAEDRLDWLKQEVYSYAALSHRFKKVCRATIRGENHTYYMRHYQYALLPSASLNFGTRPLPKNWDISPVFAFSRRIEKADSLGVDTMHKTRLVPTANLSITSPDLPFGRLDISDRLILSSSRTRYRGEERKPSLNLDHEFSVSTSQKIFGILNTAEAFAFSQSDELTDTLPPEPRYNLAINTGFNLYRVFGVSTFNLDGILHTLSPNIQFSYQPEITPQGLFGRPTPFYPSAAMLAFNINNGFQAKTSKGKGKFDIGTVNFSSRYDLVSKDLSPIYATISTRPLVFLPQVDSNGTRNRYELYLDANLSFQPESLRLGNDYSTVTSLFWSHMRTDTVRDYPRGFECRLNHTWGKNQNMLTGSVSFSYTGWRLSLNSIGYNFATGQLTDYSINLWRDLHCWEAIATLSGLGKQWRYDFEVRIKKLPDVKFGKSTFRTFLP